MQQPLRQCEACHHIQLWQLPSESDLVKYYETTYSAGRKRFQDKAYQRTMALRAKAQVNYISKWVTLTPEVSIVDYGCGYGALVAELSKLTPEVVGLEYDDESIIWAREQGIKVEKISEEHALFDRPSCDLVTMSHVLEHLLDPNAFLARLQGHSTYVFVEVPHYDLTIPGQWRDQLGHINFFNPLSLRKIFEANQFQVLDISRCGPSMWGHWSARMQWFKRKLRLLPYFRDQDYFHGVYTQPNPKGIWLRVLAKAA